MADAKWNHSWIHCSGTTVAATLRTSDLKIGHPIDLSGSALVDRYLLAIGAEIQGNARPDLLILENYFIIWMRELQRASLPVSDPHQISIRLASVRKFVEANVDRQLTLKEMAEHTNLSVARLGIGRRLTNG